MVIDKLMQYYVLKILPTGSIIADFRRIAVRITLGMMFLTAKIRSIDKQLSCRKQETHQEMR